MALPKDKVYMLLAVRHTGRKGEFNKEFKQLAHDGFARVRINKKIYDISDLPTLDRRFKYDIEVVVYRFRINPDKVSTLADSLETAIDISNGLIRVMTMDNEEKLLLSSKHACPYCQFTVSELEPKLFSFNSPIGACSDCDGLGVREQINPQRLIVHPELTIRRGAIKGWGEKYSYNFSILERLAELYKFDINIPWKQLGKKIQKLILQGASEKSAPTSRRHHYQFEGIVPYLTRRLQESASRSFRDYIEDILEQSACQTCQGSRLNAVANSVYLEKYSIQHLCQIPIEQLRVFLPKLKISGSEKDISDRILQEINRRLEFLDTVGLGYLSIGRSSNTLSGGESQRIRLASQIGAGLVGVMYVLDEPSIGLHQKDTARLFGTLKALRDMDNTIIIVEHDEEIINSADYVIDIGPGAGELGGHIVAVGSPAKIKLDKKSLTGQFLNGTKTVHIPHYQGQLKIKNSIHIKDASLNNLKKISVDIPIGVLTCVTGVSGSGKSTLVNDTLCRMSMHHLHRSQSCLPNSGKISGLEKIDKAIVIDQSPIGRTPRSNPATYTGLFAPIRDLFAAMPEARARGYKPGRFSFNVASGVCEKCRGDGLIRIEMHFLSDMYVKCDACDGRRYNQETLQIKFKDKNILDILNMTVDTAAELFSSFAVINAKLQTLIDVGLGYIRLGQSAVTLSGGEAQRIKLSRELSKRDTGQTLYILDEPTVGLHFQDVDNLIHVLAKLRDRGNTLVVIEHNLDVIKNADWIIDLGPEGGEKGGQVVATGTPKQVSTAAKSYTGTYLRQILKTKKNLTRTRTQKPKSVARRRA